MDQKDDLRHIQVGFKLVARRTKTLLFFLDIYIINKWHVRGKSFQQL